MQVNLLGLPLTKDYAPSTGIHGSTFTSLSRYPGFQLIYIPEMLIDPKIQFGMYLITGSIISKGNFLVDAENTKVAEYVQATLERFKLSGMEEALTSLIYGWGCSENMFESRSGLIHYKEAKYLLPLDCKPVKSNRTGNLAGAVVKVKSVQGNRTDLEGRIILGGPKCLWTIHGKARSPWFGVSRLYNAFLPWLEKWSNGGYRDCRRLFFYKQAFDGGVMYYPEGTTQLQLDSSTSQGRVISNRDLARDMIDQLRTGGSCFLPSIVGTDGQQRWQWTKGEITGTPDGLFQYGDGLDVEILEGLGIPREVIQSAGESSGAFGGRSVPMDAFCSILHTVYCSLISDFVKQVIHPLVILNFGPANSYFSVKPYGILTENDQVDEQQEEDEGKGPQKPGEKKTGEAMSIPIKRIQRSWNGWVQEKQLQAYEVVGGSTVDYA